MRCLAISLIAFANPVFALAAESPTVPATAPSVDASAHSEKSTTRYELSLFGAYGIGGKLEDSSINRFGPGVGLRAGLTFGAVPIYVGVRVTKFFGGSDTSGKYYTDTLDAELGYSIGVLHDSLWFRPQLGFGLALPVSIQPDNSGYPLGVHLAPGLVGGLQVSSLLLTLGVHEDVVVGDWPKATTVTLGVGATF